VVWSGILVVSLAAGGTLAIARSRSVPRSIVVMALLAGWVPLAVILFWQARTDTERQLTLLTGLAWASLVYGGVWFISGNARSSTPTWPWVCPDCRYANSRGVLRCEACGTAWESEDEG
jgi:hypothetical protein